MPAELNFRAASWPLERPFRISRGVKTAADVVQVEIRRDGAYGRGEAVPYARYGESVASVLEQLQRAGPATDAGLSRSALDALLPAGAARNALDCALWDLEARSSGIPVHTRRGESALAPMVSAVTISLDTAERMGEAARAVAAAPLIKIKVDADAPDARIRAVRAAAPGARLIVDPNESWNLDLLRTIQPVLRETRVALIEQPLPAGADDGLAGFHGECPLCADESCHTSADLDAVAGRYQVVNIKLDKTGGLSEALRLLRAARGRGLGVMVGCMVASSLAIAPALHVARHADFVDLDGPWWLREDHADGVRIRDGMLSPPRTGFWGDGKSAIAANRNGTA
ncbi:MAG: dipeptide epimerase [Rudaea sp.]|uniref:N-acetyl-D-Glu racemase DgcA n=1 Tax=Rudaea sp. TaxID=2136325 RepID=UPI0039E46170